jgi:hypothetical protein
MKDLEFSLKRRRSVLSVLWALIFAKCFLLEYWVLVYAVPINSIIYVWSLSLFMATVASAIYVNLNRKEQGRLNLTSPTALIWSGCFALIALTAVGSLALDLLPFHRFPAIAAGILGCTYAGQYFNRREPSTLYSTAGWFLAAGLLLSVTWPLTLLYFSISLILFSALTSLVAYFKLRRYKGSYVSD